MERKSNHFSGQLGFVLAAAGSAVARRIQRLGTRAGMAAGQPHDAGRTARASPGSPLMGSAHLPRSSSQRHRLGALLRLPDPRATRLNGR